MITRDDLTAAAEGHSERTLLYGPSPIGDLFASIDADGGAVQELLRQTAGMRGVSVETFYGSGWIDGFVQGVRAAREEARREIRA